MTARKLHMPGVRERTEGGAGAGASANRAGTGVQSQELNGNGVFSCAAAEGMGRLEGESNSQQQGGGGLLLSPIMQPLPLASRHATAAGGGAVASKPSSLRPAASALRSTWIQRLRPAFADGGGKELGHEVVHVWRDPQTSLWGRGLASASHSPPPFLLPGAAPKEQENKEKEQDFGTGERMAMADAGREVPSGKVAGNGHFVMKGKGPQESGHGHEPMVAKGVHDLGQKNESKGIPRKAAEISSHARNFEVEGGSRAQRQQENNHHHDGFLAPRVESRTKNGSSGAAMRGFGSLRLVPKHPTKAGTVGRSSPDHQAAAAMDGRTEAADLGSSYADFRHLNIAGAVRKVFDAQAMPPSEPGTKFTPLPKSPLPVFSKMGSEHGGPSSRPSEFAGGKGFLAPKRKPVVVNSNRADISSQQPHFEKEKETLLDLKVAEPTPHFMPFGEDPRAHRHKSWYQSFVGNGSAGEKPKMGCHKSGHSFIPSCSLPDVERKEDKRDDKRDDFVQALNFRHHHDPRGGAAPDASGKMSSGFGVSIPQGGVKCLKMKEVVGTASAARDFNRSHTDLRSPSQLKQQQQQQQQQASQGILAFASQKFLGEPSLVKQPLPFSPHSSFAGEDVATDLGEGAVNSRGERGEPGMSLLTPLFGAQRSRQDRANGGTGQVGQAPWRTMFGVFTAPKYPLPQNSTSSSGPSRGDGPSRVHDRSSPGNRPAGSPENRMGGRGEANLPESSGGDRSLFDYQSSHFASSPWPDNALYHPDDDARSGPHNSQATASAYYSRVGQTQPVAVGTSSKGREGRKYLFDTGGVKDGCDRPGMKRDQFGGETRDFKKPSDSLWKGARESKISNDENQGCNSTRHFEQLGMNSLSGGQKDDSSGSSPPSCPVDYNNNSDMCSPVVARAYVDEHLISKAIQSRTVEVKSAMEGGQFARRQQGFANTSVGVDSRWWRGCIDVQGHNIGGGQRDYRYTEAVIHKDNKGQKDQPRDHYQEVGSKFGRPNGAGESGLKHGRLQTSGEAMGEAGISGPSKRSRPNIDSHDLAQHMEGSGLPSREHENGNETHQPSSWLQRWRPPTSGNTTKPPGPFVRVKDNPWVGFTSKAAKGSDNLMGSAGNTSPPVDRADVASGKRIDEGNGSKGSKSIKNIAARRGPNALSQFPMPSAAGMALVGTAARKLGPSPLERKGSFAMWSSVRLQNAQASDSQRPVQSSELPVYIEQS